MTTIRYTPMTDYRKGRLMDGREMRVCLNGGVKDGHTRRIAMRIIHSREARGTRGIFRSTKTAVTAMPSSRTTPSAVLAYLSKE